jgi:hypothetical protein
VIIGFAANWKFGLVVTIFGVSFVLLEKRWYPKTPDSTTNETSDQLDVGRQIRQP